ncbi:neurogenic protein big brain isoform X2 [Daktulosphaira vitifoliae]|uniref:neurogenic protein big brain isoform X2 n=1 Tax=Daktulosphaira vitifoliae TaxID=58002 RepID=UPI0021AA0C85|nr:neurogenic protein big brain isoform X2 [Daktulosphaira vitifoliae]
MHTKYDHRRTSYIGPVNVDIMQGERYSPLCTATSLPLLLGTFDHLPPTKAAGPFCGFTAQSFTVSFAYCTGVDRLSSGSFCFFFHPRLISNMGRLDDDMNQLDHHLNLMLDAIERIERNRCPGGWRRKPIRLLPMQAELRTLELWRSVMAECLATFLYVAVVCGAATSDASPVLGAAAASGFTMLALTVCLQNVSGGHINPALTTAMLITRRISPIRTVMFIAAQCGGAVGGAAIIYSVSARNYFTSLYDLPNSSTTPWQRFSLGLVLMFFIVFTYYVTNNTFHKWTGTSATAIGAVYFACGLVAMPFINPACAFGPALVMNHWDNHWVYWFGPGAGGIIAGIVYDLIFNPQKRKATLDDLRDDENMCQIQVPHKVIRPPLSPPTLSPEIDIPEPLYEGSKSLYTRSPVLTRANLSRSQSLYYSKSTHNLPPRDYLPRPGPLLPAQSLYPLTTASATTACNDRSDRQNQQNQQRQYEPTYGTRSSTTTTTNIASGNHNGGVYPKSNRSDSYRQPPKDSADDLYGMYGNTQNKTQNHHGNHSRSEYVYRWTPPNSVMHEYS